MEIDIDDTTPTDLTMITQDPEVRRVNIIQGALASRIQWKTMTEESVEDLKRDLDKGLPDDSMVLIRDMANAGRHTLMFGSTVLRYDDCTVQDIPMEDLVKELQTAPALRFKPELPWPLVSWTECDSGLAVTVRMTGVVRMFRDRALGITEPERIFLPPLWVATRLTTDHRPTQMAVAVVPDEADTADATTLYHLPLPNVYPGGKICFGSVTSRIALSDSPSVKEAIAWQFGRFIGGESNMDLLDVYEPVSREVYDKLAIMAPEVKKRFDGYLAKSSRTESTNVLRFLAMLTLPTGWAQCTYAPMNDNAKGVFL